MDMKKLVQAEPSQYEGGIQAGETAYISKYATTKGIIEAVVRSAHGGYGQQLEWLVQVEGDRNLYYQGKDLFKTRREAVEESVKLVTKKLESLDKSRSKLRDLKSHWMDELIAG